MKIRLRDAAFLLACMEQAEAAWGNLDAGRSSNELRAILNTEVYVPNDVIEGGLFCQGEIKARSPDGMDAVALSKKLSAAAGMMRDGVYGTLTKPPSRKKAPKGRKW